MGTSRSEDRFVVITDGQKQVHLDLMWRDKIPADWEPVRPGANRRIACEVPVDFGQPPGTPSLNEQSVLIRGTSAVLVNNLQGYDELIGRPAAVTAVDLHPTRERSSRQRPERNGAHQVEPANTDV